MLLTQQLSTVANKNLAHPAYRYLDKETSYSEVRARVARLSYLFQHEIGHGARVAYLASNAPAVLLTFFALTNTRSVSIPMDPTRPPEELVAWLKESRATHLAVTSDLLGKAREILQSARLSLPIIEIEKKQGGEYDTSFTAPSDVMPLETDIVLLLRTAGVTGKPKLAAFNHKQLIHGTACLRGLYHPLATDRFTTRLSWSHPFAFLHALLFPILSGATCVIDHGLEGTEFLNFLAESRTTRMIGTPSYFYKLLLTYRNDKRTLPAAMKSITVAGGSLPPEAVQVYHLMNCGVAHCYGQTENIWTIAMQDTRRPDDKSGGEPDPGLDPRAARPLAGLKYKVLDEAGDEIPGPDARTGLLAVSGPTVMCRYDGPDEKALEKETKSAIRGTWLYTGDVARLEGEGESLSITLLGRKKDLLRAGEGYIAMEEVNEILRSIKGVADGAGFVTQTGRGESIVACAVVKTTGSPLNEKAILDACSKGLFEESAPKAVVFTDAIPRDFGNNPNYTRLRAQFSGIAG